MLIKSIVLNNFRQFKSANVKFADDLDGKNVTLIMGENGSGKTTFEQSFFWCLYGKTEFKDKILLNKDVEKNLMNGERADVSVCLTVQKGNEEFVIKRKNIYAKSAGLLKLEKSSFLIDVKDSSGNTQQIKPTELDYVIKRILPQELSRYFFFDGEKIDKMSKDISVGSKSTEFSDAVNGLLGLNAIKAAINHFNPKRNYGVIGTFESEYKKLADGNEELESLNYLLEESNNAVNKLENQLKDLNANKDNAILNKDALDKELKSLEEARNEQETRENCEKDIIAFDSLEKAEISNLFDDFSNLIPDYLIGFLLDKVREILNSQDLSDKDIPSITEDTINTLLKNGVCICGTHLEPGTLAFDNLIKLKDYVPPKSVSSYISDFKKELLAVEQNNKDKNLIDISNTHLSKIVDFEDRISLAKEQVDRISESLTSNASQRIADLENRRHECERVINDASESEKKIYEHLGGLKQKISDAESKRAKLAINNENTIKLEKYRQYAYTVYRKLSETYEKREREVRNELEKNINDIFQKIFNGDFHLVIDDSYHVNVTAKNYGEIEASTAQSISVIFAFIMGIIRMAREKQASENNDATEFSEPYPLVMDAPLSTFDKKRIQNVCEALPNIAEQVIIFIKDTDGELAENYMSSKIGTRYILEKVSDVETILS